MSDLPTIRDMGDRPLGRNWPNAYAELRVKYDLMRSALVQIRVTCDGNAAPSCDKGMALSFVGQIVAHALKEREGA